MPETFDFRALTLRQKSCVTHEDLMNKFLRYRLMERGITRPMPYEPIPEPDMPAFVTTPRWELMKGNTGTGIVFSGPEALATFCALGPIAIEERWYLKSYAEELNIKGHEVGKDFTIRPLDTVSEADAERLEKWARQRNEIREKNKAGKKEAESGNEAYDECVTELTDEWRSAGAKVAKHMQVIATFEEYKRMAGNDDIAMSFLEKAYTSSEINSALAFRAEDTTQPGGAE